MAKIKYYHNVKIVENSDKDKFTNEVNSFLVEGYEILSTSCSMINSEAYDFASFYQAMLLSPERREEVD